MQRMMSAFVPVSLMALACCVGLSGCGSLPAQDPAAATPENRPVAGTTINGATLFWEHYRLPGKRATDYDFAPADGAARVRAKSSSSASMLRTTVRVPADSLGTVKFSWKVQTLIPNADMALRESDDSPARIVLAFDGDRSRFSAKDAMLSELARAVTGEEMPYATLMYVWCNNRPVGSVIAHPRSSRIKAIVVESGNARLARWVGYERDLAADYRLAFGEAPGALVGVGLMTDSDNTASSASAWYGAVDLRASTTTAAQH